jgi:hypothetical protein
MTAGVHPTASRLPTLFFPLAWPLTGGPPGPTRQRRAPRRPPLPSTLGRCQAGLVHQRAFTVPAPTQCH